MGVIHHQQWPQAGRHVAAVTFNIALDNIVRKVNLDTFLLTNQSTRIMLALTDDIDMGETTVE